MRNTEGKSSVSEFGREKKIEGGKKRKEDVQSYKSAPKVSDLYLPSFPGAILEMKN